MRRFSDIEIPHVWGATAKAAALLMAEHAELD
jgi:hypothetical protein